MKDDDILPANARDVLARSHDSARQALCVLAVAAPASTEMATLLA